MNLQHRRSDALDYFDSARFHRHATRALVVLFLMVVGAAGLGQCDMDDSRTNAPTHQETP